MEVHEMDELLTKADVAKVLGITPDAVIYLEHKDLPHRVCGVGFT